MVKFERVKDPERVKDGDLLVFPAGAARLNLKPSTWSGLGLSMGDTGRSDNSVATVASWLCTDFHTHRAFMLCNVSGKSMPSADDLLLTLDATSAGRPPPETPLYYSASIVPFGPSKLGWHKWCACWNEASGNAVFDALSGKLGAKGALERDNGGPDSYMTQVWDGDWRLAGLDKNDGDWDDADCWFPMVDSAGQTSADSFDLPTVASWCGGYNSKDDRIHFHSGFVAKCAERGAVVLRPDDGFRSLVTDDCVRWFCTELSRRFERRARSGRHYLKGLADDIRRDGERARACSFAAYTHGRRGNALRRAVVDMLELKGVKA